MACWKFSLGLQESWREEEDVAEIFGLARKPPPHPSYSTQMPYRLSGASRPYSIAAGISADFI
jgi:hypothetical protein